MKWWKKKLSESDENGDKVDWLWGERMLIRSMEHSEVQVGVGTKVVWKWSYRTGKWCELYWIMFQWSLGKCCNEMVMYV